MSLQSTFSAFEFSVKRKKSRREEFLETMEAIIPWENLYQAILPFYPKGHRGRPPIALRTILRVYFLQQWFGLSDAGLEDNLYDSQAMCRFAAIDYSTGANVPDATTLLKFRKLLTENNLQDKVLDVVNELLAQKGILLKQGTIVDATIIAAPSSTKNQKKERDPEMGHTKKGQQCYFGSKLHIGVDADSGCAHSVHTTSAREADITATRELMHQEEEMVFADAGYIGVEKRDEMQEFVENGVDFKVAQKRGQVGQIAHEELKEATKKYEKGKSGIRAKVEHVFHVIKDIFRHRKVRYRGIRKNHQQNLVLVALANLYLKRKLLLTMNNA